jgi:hydrogenase maturation factor
LTAVYLPKVALKFILKGFTVEIIYSLLLIKTLYNQLKAIFLAICLNSTEPKVKALIWKTNSSFVNIARIAVFASSELHTKSLKKVVLNKSCPLKEFPLSLVSSSYVLDHHSVPKVFLPGTDCTVLLLVNFDYNS